MPFDGNGIYTRPVDSVTGVEFDYTADLAAGKPRSIVDAADMDAHFDDIKAALSKTLLRDTTVAMTADQNFNGKSALNVLNITFDGNLTYLDSDASNNFSIRTTSWATTGTEIRIYDDANYWGQVARGTEWCGFQIGQGRTSDGQATLQFRAASAHADWSSYISRAGGSNGVFEFRNQGTGAIQLRQLDAGSIAFFVNNTLRGEWTTGGDFSVKTGNLVITNSVTSASGLTLGTAPTDAIALLDDTYRHQMSPAGIYWSKPSSPTSNTYVLIRVNSSTYGSIAWDGATGTNYNQTSDRRLKTKVRPFEGASKALSLLRVKEFEAKEHPGVRSVGMIAQQAIKVYDKNVSRTDDGFLCMDYGKYTPLLIAGWQDHDKAISAHGEDIAELQHRIETLEDMLS